MRSSIPRYWETLCPVQYGYVNNVAVVTTGNLIQAVDKVR